MVKLKRKQIALYLIVLFALYAVIYLVPQAFDKLTPSYTAEYGELQTSDEVDEAYIVRSEKVYYAKKGGKSNYLMKSGKLVRKDSRIMEVTGNSGLGGQLRFTSINNHIDESARVYTSSFKTKSEGVVYYSVDKYASDLTPDTMKKWTQRKYHKLDNDLTELKRKRISEGDPVYRIVDRSSWYLVCYIPKGHMDRYKKGNSVTIQLGSRTITGEVNSIQKQGSKVQLILRTTYYYADFATTRTVSIKVITADSMGIVIKNSSISEKKGTKGVYVKNTTGDYVFTPIQIISTDGEKSTITRSYFYDKKGNSISTVKNYDEVLTKGR